MQKPMFDYTASDNHILTRRHLPPRIRETLLESTREQWADHPRFGGKAGFFMTIHRDLLNGSARLSTLLEAVLDAPDSDLQDQGALAQVVGFGRRLIGFAHHHHDIEDHGYFPQFMKLYPRMDRAMKLLDGDHRVLEETLHDTERTLLELEGKGISRDRLARMHQGSKALETILNRHIWDEEEIIIPIFLEHS